MSPLETLGAWCAADYRKHLGNIDARTLPDVWDGTCFTDSPQFN